MAIKNIVLKYDFHFVKISTKELFHLDHVYFFPFGKCNVFFTEHNFFFFYICAV